VNLQEATLLEDDIDRSLAGGDLDRAEELAVRYVRAARTSGGHDPARSPRFRSGYLAAQVALRAGRLEQAAQRLAELMPLPALPPALACRIELMSAEVQARLQQLDAARAHLERARECGADLRGDPLLHLRELRVRLWLGEVAHIAGDLATCARALQEQADHANLALLLCEEGRAWDAAGDLERAENCWRRAEGISRGLGRDAVRADVQLQLGRLAHLRGHLQDALDRYAGSLAASPAAPQTMEIQLRRLLVLLDLNQWGQAQAGYQRIVGGASPDSLPQEVRGLATMVQGLLAGTSSGGAEVPAYLAAARGELAAARALYEQALRAAAGPVRRARLALALGMLALACGDGAEAARWLGEAERLARTRDMPEVLWRTLQARGQMAAEMGGEDESARRLFEEAVLVSEEQAARLRHRTDAAAHHLHRADVLRQLMRAACRRGDAAAVFRYQELERGRLLLDLWRAAPPGAGRTLLQESSTLADVDRRLAALEGEIERGGSNLPAALGRRREELLLERDRLLDEYLRDRSRRGDAALPALPALSDLEKSLPAGTVYVAPVRVDDELYLLVARPGQGTRLLRAPGSAVSLTEEVRAFRRCLEAQLERYRRGYPLGWPERAELDGRLADLAHGSLGEALGIALDGPSGAPERLLWVPDEGLHGLPIHALRRGGRYLIEEREVVFTFGGSLLVHQARTARETRRSRRAVVVTESESVLPDAAHEGQGVAASFWRARLLHGATATRTALRKHLAGTGVAHFACHAHFDVEHPLAACITLPSGESWRALEWLDEPLAGLPLVTLSACRSAEVAPLVGREVFGLVTGLLGSGVRAVVAGLWPVADREAGPFMWRFYRHRLTADLPTALALAQRESAAGPAVSPLFWAAFGLFGDPCTLPAPGRWWRWLARWRQRRHARRFPVQIPNEST
jgi:tetratricopeptide (TPR) repeat protein